MENNIPKTSKQLMKDLNGNYVQVVTKNGKNYEKLFKDPQRAIRAVGGVHNVLHLREVLKEQVDTKYVGADAITDTPEETL
jgi:hypothetical protein